MMFILQKYLEQYGYLQCSEGGQSAGSSRERSRGSSERGRASPERGGTSPERGRTSTQRGGSSHGRRMGLAQSLLPSSLLTEGESPTSPHVVHTQACDFTPQQVARALSRYQAAYGLTATGRLDAATLDVMNRKRCGNPDDINDIVLDGMNGAISDRDTSSARSSSERDQSLLHKVVRRSAEKLIAAKRKARLLIAERHHLKIQEAGLNPTPSQPSSLLSQIFLFKSKRVQPHSQSYVRRKQLLDEYMQAAEVESSTTHQPSNYRLGSFISSKHSSAVVQVEPTSRRKRSLPLARSGYQRFNLDRRDCIRWRLLSEGYSQRLTVRAQRALLQLAFRMWAEVTPLCFIEDNTSPISNIDIPIAFYRSK